MNKKLILVIALIGIGLYALPATMSLFAGQHTFVNIDATGNQIDCVKCHGDVQAELGVNTDRGTILSASQKPHSGFKCEYCHRIEAGAASGDNAYAIVTYTNGSTLTVSGNKNMRTIAMTLADFEEEKFPLTISNDITSLTGLGLSSNAALSPTSGTYVYKGVTYSIGSDTDTTVLTIYNEYVQPTMSVGVPIDTSTSKYDGLNLNAVGMGWTSGSRYWTPNLVGAGSRTMTPGTEYHAASLVSCLECHGGFEPLGHYSRVLDGEEDFGTSSDAKCYDCHYGYTNRIVELAAGGFGITGGADTGAQEAHMEFQTTDDTLTQYKAVGSESYSNGACISCHTHVKVDIKYTKPTTLQFDVDMTNSNEVLTNQVTGAPTVSYSGAQPPRSVP